MKKIILPIYIIFLFSSCGSKSDDSAKQKELELKAKELELKEKELEQKKTEESSSKDEISEESKASELQNNTGNPAPSKKTKDELRQETFKKESLNPEKFLSVSGSYRVNIAANTIVEGTLFNSATVSRYQYIDINVSFFSKYNDLLGSEVFTVSGYIDPGSALSFKHKIKGWWSGVTRAEYRIQNAQPIKLI